MSFGNVTIGGKPAAPAAAAKDVTTATFRQDVIAESARQPVLVDFWAPWCGPCKQLGPVLEKVVAASGGKVKMVKMNIDDHPEIAGQLGIQSIPAVIAFQRGQPVDGFVGALPESQIKQFLERIAGPMGDPVKEMLDEAAAAAAEGDPETAAAIYSEILAEDESNGAALAGLARLHLDAGDLLRRMEADPNDHQARFDYALAMNSRGKRQEAADALLDIIKADRSWNDDGARVQLLKFFEEWGFADPASAAGRRRLSGLLFR